MTLLNFSKLGFVFFLFIFLNQCKKKEDVPVAPLPAPDLKIKIDARLLKNPYAAQCLEELGGAQQPDLEISSEVTEAVQWVLPDWETWAQGATESGGVELLLKVVDSKKENMAAFYSLLGELKAPKVLSPNLGASAKAFRSSFIKASSENASFWLVETKSNQGIQLGLCNYIRSWLQSEQVIRGSGLQKRTKGQRVDCDFTYRADDSMPISEDSVKFVRLPIPIWDADSSRFPYLTFEDCKKGLPKAEAKN